MNILEKVWSHQDLAVLDDEQRKLLCQQIREFLVSSVSQTGGHLASNLGVVELTVAIETAFDTEKDRLVFDVGHQSYVHKLLTGRQADFAGLRKFGGIAGFPKPSESETDAFVAGHASTSVSIALGMARARTLQGQDHHIVALIGDGAVSGGVAYEGLNDAAVSNEPMIIILNDNEMSIERNVGGMARHLSNLRIKKRYLGMKQRYRKLITKIPGGNGIYRFTHNIKDGLRRALIPETIFESMGFDYLGPVDGHDLPGLISLLNIAKEWKRPVVVHVLTQKGKGYEPAEVHPERFHGVGAFDPVTGVPYKVAVPGYSDAFGRKLCQLAAEDRRICAITAAMPGGTGLLKFQELFPQRTFDVGIAEEHAVSLAGGLAKQGMIPVVAIYSTFMQRSFDMIMQDVALLGLHVVFAVDRAGLVGEDGETHHGVFDLGMLRQVPGMTVLSPGSAAELEDMLSWAVNVCTGPVAIRYPRGSDSLLSTSDWDSFGMKMSVSHREGQDVAFVTYGSMYKNVDAAAQILENCGIHATVVRLMQVAPLPIAEILHLIANCENVIVVEETVAGSGVWEQLAVNLHAEKPNIKTYGLNLGCDFVTHGTIADLYANCGLDPSSIADYVMEVLKVEN